MDKLKQEEKIDLVQDRQRSAQMGICALFKLSGRRGGADRFRPHL